MTARALADAAGKGSCLTSTRACPPGHRPVTTSITATLKARVEALQAELAKVEASAAGHHADFERERVDRLSAELLRATADSLSAKQAAARLDGRAIGPAVAAVVASDGGLKSAAVKASQVLIADDPVLDNRRGGTVTQPGLVVIIQSAPAPLVPRTPVTIDEKTTPSRQSRGRPVKRERARQGQAVHEAHSVGGGSGRALDHPP
jgi:hypothetical protein